MKDEGGILISGELLIRYSEDNLLLKEKIIKPGESFHFPPYCIHQEEALKDSIIIEVTTPHFNDRVRMEKSLGKKMKKDSLLQSSMIFLKYNFNFNVKNFSEKNLDLFKITDPSYACVIAEIGNNHQGSFDRAIKLIDEAIWAGADAVKFQKRCNKKLFTLISLIAPMKTIIVLLIPMVNIRIC